MKKRAIKAALILNILFAFIFSVELRAQSLPAPIQVPNYDQKNVYLNNPNSTSIVIAYSFDKIHWTKTIVPKESKKTLSMQPDADCYIRVYTDKNYALFQVEKGKKYKFAKKLPDDTWEIEQVSGD